MLWNPTFDWNGPPYHFIDMFAGEANASRMWTLLCCSCDIFIYCSYSILFQPMQCRKHERFHCARFDRDYGKNIGRPLNCFAHDCVLTECMLHNLCIHLIAL